MPAVKNVGEPCEGELHARFDGGREETSASRQQPCGTRRLLPTRPFRPIDDGCAPVFAPVVRRECPCGRWMSRLESSRSCAASWPGRQRMAEPFDAACARPQADDRARCGRGYSGEPEQHCERATRSLDGMSQICCSVRVSSCIEKPAFSVPWARRLHPREPAFLPYRAFISHFQRSVGHFHLNALVNFCGLVTVCHSPENVTWKSTLLSKSDSGGGTLFRRQRKTQLGHDRTVALLDGGNRSQ
jgi:hypothetical protein